MCPGEREKKEEKRQWGYPASYYKEDKIPGTNSGNLTWANKPTALFKLPYESRQKN
jgi:hypothetical protein